MEIDIKNKDKVGKIVTIILVGVLLLVVLAPVKSGGGEGSSQTETNNAENYDTYADYYEKKLKSILEHSYGEGTMQVMVHLTDGETNNSLYASNEPQVTVDGVLIVADVESGQAVSDITFAVCALFDLPAHKVAVMIKN